MQGIGDGIRQGDGRHGIGDGIRQGDGMQGIGDGMQGIGDRQMMGNESNKASGFEGASIRGVAVHGMGNSV